MHEIYVVNGLCYIMRHNLFHLGVRGTYQGLTATVLKQGTNQAIRFYVMNALRNWYKGEKESLLVNPLCFFWTFPLFSYAVFFEH